MSFEVEVLTRNFDRTLELSNFEEKGGHKIYRIQAPDEFLKETDFAPHQASEVFALAQSFKKGRGRHTPPSLKGQTWGMIFSKSSTRTRVSFDVGIHELGGHPIFLNKNDIQLGRGESVYDTANVLSRFVHGLIVRTFEQSELEELSKMGSIPVINALTDFLHPCQTYTDAFSMAERWSDGTNHLESLKGKKMAYFGDTANNIANSWYKIGGPLSVPGTK